MGVRTGICLVASFLVLTLVGVTVSAETFGVKKRRPKPHEYGTVVINNASEASNIAPVVFRHWLHRARYTCRLCHVDIGFAMAAGKTGITEDDNRNGFYCGACHNGREAFAPEQKSASGEKERNCDRCHSLGMGVKMKSKFYEFRKKFSRERFGNGIDWLKAEEEGKIKLKDYIEGVSIRRRKLKQPKDMELKPHELGMPDIIFSHRKHAVWNGCELCHPDIFGVKKGSTVYSMQDIFNGKYCGACHGKVAFPNIDCQRCHTREVY